MALLVARWKACTRAICLAYFLKNLHIVSLRYGSSKVLMRVLEVNFWIPANSCMNSCYFLICCSRCHSLFKKSMISSNGQVLAEKELSEWDPCGNIPPSHSFHAHVWGIPLKPGLSLSGCFSSTEWSNFLNFFRKNSYPLENKTIEFQLNCLSFGWIIQKTKPPVSILRTQAIASKRLMNRILVTLYANFSENTSHKSGLSMLSNEP